ncbi:MAG: AIR synthase family protein [Candidatus Thermoplasmatota archaeon]
MSYFPTGKLNTAFLEKMFDYFDKDNSRLVVGPKIGEDAAVIDMPDQYLVAKTDPVTLARDEEIGWYAVNVNANDVAVTGAKPKWFQVTMLLPENKSDEDMVKNIFSQIEKACGEIDVTVVGGHSEVTPGLNTPILVGSMIGEVEKDKLVKTSSAEMDDDLILTKGIVVEGTSIVAREKEEELLDRGFDEGFVQKAKNYLYKPGISVVKDALLANQYKVHSMHDPTEGGLSMGLFEMMKASDKGVLVNLDNVPVLPCSEICIEFDLDVFNTISSGSLLISAPPSESDKIIHSLKNNNIEASVIGKVKEKDFGLKVRENDEVRDLSFSEKDEITKLF